MVPLDADDCLAPEFLEVAVSALERRPEFDVVVPTAGYFVDGTALSRQQFCAHAPFLVLLLVLRIVLPGSDEPPGRSAWGLVRVRVRRAIS